MLAVAQQVGFNQLTVVLKLKFNLYLFVETDMEKPTFRKWFS